MGGGGGGGCRSAMPVRRLEGGQRRLEGDQRRLKGIWGMGPGQATTRVSS